MDGKFLCLLVFFASSPGSRKGWCVSFIAYIVWSSNFGPPANVEYQLESIIIFSKYSRFAAINSRSSAILLFTSCFILPSRGLTYPTCGKGKSSSNMPYQGDVLISWRVIALFQFSNVNCIIAGVNCRGLFRRLTCVMHCTCAATSCCKHAFCVFCHNNMDTYDFTIYISYMILYLYISHGSLCFKWMF